MARFVSIASAFTLALLVGSQAIAQQPPANPPSGGTPDAMPFDIPYGTAITAEKAKQILAAAEAEAKKRNWPVEPVGGEQLAALAKDAIAQPPEVIARLKKLLAE